MTRISRYTNVCEGLCLALTVLVAFPLLAQAEDAAPASRLVEASLFKNGMAFLVREVDVPGPGSWRVGRLPVPVHGTFWILPATPGLEIKGATALQEEIPTKGSETSLRNLLLLNRGRALDVKTSLDGWMTCEVVSAPSEAATPAPLAAEEPGYGESRSAPGYLAARSRPTAPSEGQEYVLLRNDKGTVAVRWGDIQAVRSPSGALLTEVSAIRRESAVRIHVASGKGKARIICLTRGLAWAPSYVVDISDPREAVVRSKAVIVNDGEDLKGVQLNLIAGYPNIAFEQSPDAFTPTLSLPAFLRGLQAETGRRSPVVAQQAVLSNAGTFNVEDAAPTAASSGEVREDLFLHPVRDVTLRAGERGYQPLFEDRVPYLHVYVWEIGDSVEGPDRWREESQFRSGQAISREDVWHNLKLKNTGRSPWSTGPAMSMQENRVLGQDTLYFTSPGGDTLLRITRAMDVVADRKEVEVSRQRDAPSPYSGHWDLVTVKGELQVANRKGQPVTMLIRKAVSGEIGTCSIPPAIETAAEGLKKVNPQQRLTWEVPVKAQERLKITYTYKVLVAR